MLEESKGIDNKVFTPRTNKDSVIFLFQLLQNLDRFHPKDFPVAATMHIYP